jgi:hypothetical protein
MEEKDEVILNIRLGYEDYKHLNLEHGKVRRSVMMLIYSITIIAAVLYKTFKENTGGEAVRKMLFLAIPVYIGIMIVITLITYVPMIMKLKLMLRLDDSLKEEQSYKISTDEINIANKTMEQRIKWKDIYKVKESKKSFFIYLGSTEALIIPKRFFRSENEIELFRKLSR